MSASRSHWLVGWLEGTDSDRERFRAMQARFRHGWMVGVLITACSLLAVADYGWWLVVLPVLALVTMSGGVRIGQVSRHAEVVGAVVFVMLQVNLAVSVVLTGGSTSPLLAFMVVPVFSQAVAFRRQLTLVWAPLSALMALVAIVTATRIDVPRPSPILETACFLALLGCLSVAAYDLVDADVRSRDKAARDPLTGLLNRKNLESQFARVASRLRASGEPLTLLMVDVDHFKRINDTHGHHRGDLVLRDLAQRMQISMRPADLVFRVGGEEFLILMPGLNQDTARFAADRLSRAVSDYAVAGLPITVSVGLASGSGDGIVFDLMSIAADGALYRAKQDGRNCVRIAA